MLRACLELGAATFLLPAGGALPIPRKPAPSHKRDRGGASVIQGVLVNKPWCWWYYGLWLSFDSVCVGFNEAAD